MNGSELGEPQRVAIAHVGLGARAARTAGAGQCLHLFGGHILPLFIGASDGRDHLEINNARHGIAGLAADDLAVVIEKSQSALSAVVVRQGQIIEFGETAAIGPLEKPPPPTVWRGIGKNTRERITLSRRVEWPAFQSKGRLNGESLRIFVPSSIIGKS